MSQVQDPILLIYTMYDGHASHISHREGSGKWHPPPLFALTLYTHSPATTVMSSLKNHFGKACKTFLAETPGRVITEADLAGLVGKAWPLALTSSNLIWFHQNWDIPTKSRANNRPIQGAFYCSQCRFTTFNFSWTISTPLQCNLFQCRSPHSLSVHLHVRTLLALKRFWPCLKQE